MTGWHRLAPATVVLALALGLAGCGAAASDEAPQAAAPAAAAAAVAASGDQRPPRGALADCAHRSMASFPEVFDDRRNVVAGPFALLGGAYTSAAVVREFGGDKMPAILRAGHRVTVEVARAARRHASLAYGPLPQGEIHLRDAHRVVTFEACPRGGRSGSTADGEDVTFWSGFVLTRRLGCVPLRVWVDGEDAPREVTLRFGVRRCE